MHNLHRSRDVRFNFSHRHVYFFAHTIYGIAHGACALGLLTTLCYPFGRPTLLHRHKSI